jgi:hypothetical protein
MCDTAAESIPCRLSASTGLLLPLSSEHKILSDALLNRCRASQGAATRTRCSKCHRVSEPAGQTSKSDTTAAANNRLCMLPPQQAPIAGTVSFSCCRHRPANRQGVDCTDHNRGASAYLYVREAAGAGAAARDTIARDGALAVLLWPAAVKLLPPALLDPASQ